MSNKISIVKHPRFNSRFKEILRFIALDSKSRAKSFKNKLITSIKTISDMPYKHRKSIYFDNEKIRDLIFKGYTITYEVDETNNRIIIMGIKKYRDNF